MFNEGLGVQRMGKVNFLRCVYGATMSFFVPKKILKHFRQKKIQSLKYPFKINLKILITNMIYFLQSCLLQSSRFNPEIRLELVPSMLQRVFQGHRIQEIGLKNDFFNL